MRTTGIAPGTDGQDAVLSFLRAGDRIWRRPSDAARAGPPNPPHTMKSTVNNECIDVCNELLRSELSAVETYGQTIKKFEADPAAASLGAIRGEHEQAAALLRENVLAMGGQPSTDTGAWGTFVSTAQGVAKVFGESAALKNLRDREEHALKEYNDALANADVMLECKEMIRRELLPRTERHIAVLKGLAAVR